MRETNKTFPQLFAKTGSNSIHCWSIWTEDNHIKIKFGLVGGKHQLNTKISEPKSIGRSNETTPAEQAVLEAQSMWNHKIDKGYKLSFEEAEKEEVVLPMLAKNFKDHSKKIIWPASIQRKFNGARCLSYRDHEDNFSFFSRIGKFFNLPHLFQELNDIVPSDLILDGEIYYHGYSLQYILSLLKRLQPDTATLEYHVYDCVLRNNKTAGFKERFSYLKDWFSKQNLIKVVLVETFDVMSKQEVLEQEQRFVEEGFEGAIVRANNGQYKFKHRTDVLQKVKSFDDYEFTVINWERGKDRYADCPIFVCETKDKKTFSVVPKGTMKEKKIMLDNADNYIGQQLTVRYFGYTNKGKPFHPVGIAFRPDWDLGT